jgi:hypothetical protein
VGDGVDDVGAVGGVEAGEQMGEGVAGVDAGQLGRQAQDAGLAGRAAGAIQEAGDGRLVDPGDRAGAVMVVVHAGSGEVVAP